MNKLTSNSLHVLPFHPYKIPPEDLPSKSGSLLLSDIVLRVVAKLSATDFPIEMGRMPLVEMLSAIDFPTEMGRIPERPAPLDDRGSI